MYYSPNCLFDLYKKKKMLSAHSNLIFGQFLKTKTRIISHIKENNDRKIAALKKQLS